MFVEDDVRLAWYARSIVGASSAKRCKYRTVQWKVALFVGYYGCTGKEAAVRVCDAMNSAGASSALFQRAQSSIARPQKGAFSKPQS